jgi:bifunctional DNA-binding transcriptional regulator/antitoxin component of YhaV-PrlF toxin-antitoxin module
MKHILEVLQGIDGEPYIQLPDELMEGRDWQEGDTIVWTEQEDGSFLLRKLQDDSSNEA